MNVRAFFKRIINGAQTYEQFKAGKRRLYTWGVGIYCAGVVLQIFTDWRRAAAAVLVSPIVFLYWYCYFQTAERFYKMGKDDVTKE